MSEVDLVRIASDGLHAAINPLGAELWELRDRSGSNFLWHGDPEFWSGRAPILFPIVGSTRAPAGSLLLPRHGFARRQRFEVIEQAPARAAFRLRSDSSLLESYPFEFELLVHIFVAGSSLRQIVTIRNLDSVPLPYSVGFHPAFPWPLPWGGKRNEHRVRFWPHTPKTLRRLSSTGFMSSATEPAPICEDALTLEDELFNRDALIFLEQAGSRWTYSGAVGPEIMVSADELPHLAIWSKAGAPFVCIEPWHGYSDPIDFAGAFSEKPGLSILQPGHQRAHTLCITINSHRPGLMV